MTITDRKNILIGGGVIAAAILLLAPSAYFFNKYRQAQSKLQSGEQATDEVEEILEKVGRLIELPPGEQPTVATITDVEKLKNQPFFARAKNGDRLIVYTQARRAILYDPVTDKIIDVAPLVIGDATDSAEVAATPSGTFLAATPTSTPSQTPTTSQAPTQ